MSKRGRKKKDRKRAAPTTASALTPDVEYKAEMVASVYKILTEAGAEVTVGDSLLILESMKMEIPVVAEESGRVHEICVVEGDVVGEGDALIVVV